MLQKPASPEAHVGEPSQTNSTQSDCPEVRILVVVETQREFNRICDYIHRGSGGACFSVDHAGSVGEAARLCGNHYDIAVVDTRILRRPEEWTSCRGIGQTPCVLLLLTPRAYGHVVEPANHNRALLVRGRASAGAFAATIRYGLRMREAGRCGASGEDLKPLHQLV